jgi:hypothetical protein
MSLTYEKQLDKRYVHCIYMGKGTLEETLQYVSELAQDPDFDSPFYEIVDFTKVESLDFGYYQSDRLMGKYMELGKKGYRGTVFISGSEYSKAMSKMYATVGDMKGLNLQVVETLAEAEKVIADYFSDQEK